MLLVAEQFRSDYLDRAAGLLGSGGFRRLTESGAYFPDCRLASTTFSATGLATISTGAYAEAHGIVADYWYDRGAGRPVSAGIGQILATTLADQVAEANPRNRVFVVGGTQAHASLLAGSSPKQIFHLDAGATFVAEKGGAPAWLASFQRSQAPEHFRNARWFANGARTGASPLRVLSYDGARADEFLALYLASPFSQAAQFAFLRELIEREKLGQGVNADFLCAVLSSMASLGYECGADSPLMREMTIHLDRQIEALLDVLNRAVGAGNYCVVFTGAHGAPPDPGPERRSRMAIAGAVVTQIVNRELSTQLNGPGGAHVYVERYLYPFLYLRLERFRPQNGSLREGRKLAGMAALRVPGVAGYYTADGDCSHTGDWLRRFRNSFHAVRSGDLMLAYQPDYVEDYGAGRGISYGSLYNYDARVPLCLYGPQFHAQTLEFAVEAVDIAPTLARVLGVAAPSSSTGRVLEEALVPINKDERP